MRDLRWGEPRFTRDVDATLLTGFEAEDEFILPILSSGYRGRIPDAAGFARRNRVLLIESGQGVPIDIALAGLPFEKLLAIREENLKPREVEPVSLLASYLEGIGKVIDAVDRLEK